MEVQVEKIVEKKVIEYVDRFIEREVIREVPTERIIVQEVPVYVDKIVEKTVVQEVVVTSIPPLWAVNVPRRILKLMHDDCAWCLAGVCGPGD